MMLELFVKRTPQYYYKRYFQKRFLLNKKILPLHYYVTQYSSEKIFTVIKIIFLIKFILTASLLTAYHSQQYSSPLLTADHCQQSTAHC